MDGVGEHELLGLPEDAVEVTKCFAETDVVAYILQVRIQSYSQPRIFYDGLISTIEVKQTGYHHFIHVTANEAVLNGGEEHKRRCQDDKRQEYSEDILDGKDASLVSLEDGNDSNDRNNARYECCARECKQ